MNQQGLSLIQLLVALAIIGIVAQVATPAFGELIAAHRRQVSAEQLASGLRNARTEAILRNQTVVVHGLDNDWSQGWRIIVDLSGQGHEDSDNPVLLERQDHGGVLIRGNQPVQQFVRFNGLGQPLMPGGAFQAGTLHVCATQKPLSHYQVVLSKTGRVSLRGKQAEHDLCAAQSGERAMTGIEPAALWGSRK